jgi:hypothetical protein
LRHALKARAEDDLPIDTAIRPFLILRDIRVGRKLLTPSSDDLTLLAERRLISAYNGKLVLTDASNSVIGIPT